jgi:hypothetical protein
MASLVVPAAGAAGQDGLARAKALYAAAAYDEALVLLNGLQEGGPDAATEVAQYRAFCLLALQRTNVAKSVFEGLVRADPLYRLSEAQTSPRVQSIFQDIRRAVLPEIVQRFYAEAKVAFENKDAGAGAQFDRVLALLDDPDMRGSVSADFRTLVTGFRDLSRASAAAAPPPAPPPSVPEPAAAEPPAAPAAADLPSPAADSGAAVLTSTPISWALPDSPIDPAVPISQPMPRWVLPNGAAPKDGFSGRLHLEIDERGNVVSATLEAPIYPVYDVELLKLAQTWRFKPATRDGVPVPFVTVVEIERQRIRP